MTRVKWRSYEIVNRAVEEGIAWGYKRAHKHDDNPPADHIVMHLEREIMSAICEVIDFEDDSIILEDEES